MADDIQKDARKTGTATVGIVCKDGIILAAEKRAVLGESYFIASKKMKKIFKISDDIVVTTAGLVSDIQMMLKIVKAQLRLKELRTKSSTTVKEAANLFGSIAYQNIRQFSTIPGIVHFLIGGRDANGFGLYEVAFDGTVSEHDDYITSGSYGSIMAYGILENEWNPNITVSQGAELALKVLRTAIKRDAGTGDGIDLVVIDKNGLEEREEKVLAK
jgi:proteasome beta subunit